MPRVGLEQLLGTNERETVRPTATDENATRVLQEQAGAPFDVVNGAPRDWLRLRTSSSQRVLRCSLWLAALR